MKLYILDKNTFYTVRLSMNWGAVERTLDMGKLCSILSSAVNVCILPTLPLWGLSFLK